MALLLPAGEVSGWPDGASLANLLGWSATLGLLSSWLATWLWNLASGRIPGEMLGYLIVSETVFGLIYAMLAAWHLPSSLEILGIVLLIGGVVLGLAAAPKPPRSTGSRSGTRHRLAQCRDTHPNSWPP